jgi:nucleotide-binding universal stress UspA family protein
VSTKPGTVHVGSHGRGGFTNMLLGSTSTALLHTAQCPLLIVRNPH